MCNFQIDIWCKRCENLSHGAPFDDSPPNYSRCWEKSERRSRAATWQTHWSQDASFCTSWHGNKQQRRVSERRTKREIMAKTLTWVRRNWLTEPNRRDRVNGCFSLLNCGCGTAGTPGAPGDWLDFLSYPPCHTPFLNAASAVEVLQRFNHHYANAKISVTTRWLRGILKVLTSTIFTESRYKYGDLGERCAFTPKTPH